MMSFFEIPKGVRKKLDYFRSRFFWQTDEYKRKYRLAKWDILCQPKDQGGLGVHNLELKKYSFAQQVTVPAANNRRYMAADPTQ